MNKIIGILLPTNTPDIMEKYLMTSLDNLVIAKDYVEFLINFQSPWSESQISSTVSLLESKGFKVKYKISQYEIKEKGLVPVNKIREDTASIDPDCKYYLIFDDDMTFMGPSGSINRNAGEQILESLVYLEKYDKCGLIVFGGTLIKKIKKDSIAMIGNDREYVTGKGIIYRNISPDKGLFIPKEAYDLLGSDEEKVAAGYRISQGYFVAEIPFVRINHYENQKSTRNKNGKVPGKDKYEWNTDMIKNNNNFKFIRDNYNKNYVSGKGNIVDWKLYEDNGGIPVDSSKVIDFNGIENIIKLLEV